MDKMMRQVDPSLLEAMQLVERKFTRLTLVAAMGFMVAWLPFCLLCMWELATPPNEIPTSINILWFIQGDYKRMPPYSIEIRVFFELFTHFLSVNLTQSYFLQCILD